MKRILVATDGSDGAGRAIDYAAHSATETGAELVIVNVVGAYGLPDALMRAFTQTQQVWFDELLAATSAELLTAARLRAQSAGATQVRLDSRRGEIVPEIIAAAKDSAASVIVVGKRGTGRIGELLLGSVSQRLASLAPIPVTVVP